MAISEVYTMSAVTIGSSEISIVSGNTTLQNIATAGVYQLYIDDRSNMTKTDEFKYRIYEKVLSGGSKRVVFTGTIKGVQSEVLTLPMLILMNGWDMTIIKLAGTDRAFDASIRKVA